MWLVGVVVRRYIDIIFPTPLVLALFLAAASLLLRSFLKCFLGVYNLEWEFPEALFGGN